jgi:hypothetical protein
MHCIRSFPQACVVEDESDDVILDPIQSRCAAIYLVDFS